MGLTLATAARTDAGRVRSHNEDAVFASPRLVAVADGVGGHAAGEVASAVAIGALAGLEKRRLREPLPAALEAAVREGNATIAFVAGARPATRGMGTTVCAVALHERTLVVAGIGDSRAYLLRDGALRRLTRDDSLVQRLVDEGLLDDEAARAHPQRSVVTAALDGDPGRAPALTSLGAQPGDRVLVCSDGLSDLVDDDALAEVLGTLPRERAADRLVELALAAGGRDNVSVVVADVVDGGDRAPTWD
jgi:PPM family protein phosphatase